MENPEPSSTPTPAISTPPVEAPRPPRKLSVPWILGILVVFFLATTAYLGYQNQLLTQKISLIEQKVPPTPSPTVDPTANWKSIKTVHWQFKVPTDWNYWLCDQDLIFVGANIDKDKDEECAFGMGLSPGTIQVSRTKGQNQRPIPNTDPESGLVVSDRKNVLVDEKEAIYQTETVSNGPGEGSRIYVYIKSTSWTDVIILHNLNQKDAFDQILSTFKFLEGESSTIILKIPSDWKEFTAADPSWGVKTTLFLPLGYSFFFSGSEFIIQKDSDASELWDYTTSIRGNEQGKGINTYIGGSRREWYQKYFEGVNGVGTQNKITSFEEKSEGQVSYLIASVQTPSGIDKHYLYLQNNIIHILRPSSLVANSSDSVIAKNIAIIFFSLKSTQI